MKHPLLLILAFILSTTCIAQKPVISSVESEEFISLPDSCDLKHLSDETARIIFNAAPRFSILQNGNMSYKLFPTSAEEANVSVNIYRFYENIVRNKNKNLPPLLIGAIGSKEDRFSHYLGTADCIAACISAIIPRYPHKEICTSLIDRYSDKGVPLANIEEAFKNYGNIERLDSLPEFYLGGHGFITIVCEGFNTYHAVITLKATSYGIFGFDPQKAEYVYYPDDQIISYYKLRSTI